jgi:1-acyl-sn-glycerol-3-phosphate acyltransferase
MPLSMRAFNTFSRFFKILRLTHSNGVALIRAEKKPGGLTREYCHHIMLTWAAEMLKVLNVRVHSIGTPREAPTIFLGNHMSYVDIPLIMSFAPTVFIAKKELSRWPIFGKALTAAGTVFVDRESAHSRRGAAEQIAPFIQKTKQSICIFPSGTTTLEEQKPWRWGPFLIAKRCDVPVQPFRLVYTPRRTVAFIEQDGFAVHLWNLLQTDNIEAEIEFGEPFKVGDPEEDAKKYWNWAREKLVQV